jgi:hypothetical protein
MTTQGFAHVFFRFTIAEAVHSEGLYFFW